jgi:hypothetical protein
MILITIPELTWMIATTLGMAVIAYFMRGRLKRPTQTRGEREIPTTNP